MLSNGKPKEVMNDLLRRALGIGTGKIVDLPVFHLGLKPGIDPVALNKVAEDEAFFAESRHIGS